MTRTKIQKLLNRLDGKSEATQKVITDFEVSVKALRDKLEQDISITTLQEVGMKINQLRKSINIQPLLDQAEALPKVFKQHALETIQEIENKTAELENKLRANNETFNKRIDPIIEKTNILEKGLTDFNEQNIENLSRINKNVSIIEGKLPTLADKKETKESIENLEDKIKKIDDSSKDYSDKTRIELINKLNERGGGNMNRQININSSVMSLKYTDINFQNSATIGWTATNDNTNKRVNIQASVLSGGGGGGGGVWGSITGTLSDQTDLQTALDAKAPSANPTFTGIVTLPKTVEIQDTSANHQYLLAVSELTADRTITLPLLTGNDVFVFADFIQTLTNKRITKRVVTAADATSITPNTDDADWTYQANTQSTGTLTINADSGTPTNAQAWGLKIKSTNVQTFSWNAEFVGGTNPLPTSTTGSSQIDYFTFIYDTVDGVWHFTGSAVNL